MKKITSYLIVICMLISILSGCGNNRNEKSTTKESESAKATSSASTQGVNPGVTPTEKPYFKPKKGPVGTWDIPVPFVNPLGSQSLYNAGTSFTAASDGDALKVQYIDDYVEYEKSPSGDIWDLKVDEPEGFPRQFLEEYARGLGATVYSSLYADRLTIMLKTEDGLWWCDTWATDTGYEIGIVKQKLFITGKEYTVGSDVFGNNQGANTAFVTESDGDKFQTVKGKLSSGVVNISANYIYSTPDSTYYYRYTKTLD